MTEIPRELDWVTVRSKCSLPQVFTKLKMQISEDVNVRNGLKKGEVLSIQPSGNTCTVLLERGSRPLVSVVFTLTETSIHVTDGNKNDMFDATLTLNDAGECRLKVNGRELELWQVRRRALEKLFFESL